MIRLSRYSIDARFWVEKRQQQAVYEGLKTCARHNRVTLKFRSIFEDDFVLEDLNVSI